MQEQELYNFIKSAYHRAADDVATIRELAVAFVRRESATQGDRDHPPPRTTVPPTLFAHFAWDALAMLSMAPSGRHTASGGAAQSG